MRWYYETKGTHVHVKVYMNGALCGNLTFRKEEFDEIRKTEVDGRWNKAVPDVIGFYGQEEEART